MPERGKFIVFEGIDGCGKTTQLKKLSDKLSAFGIAHIAEREPTDGVIGRLARETVKKNLVVRHETLALLFAADRIEHVENVIKPALDSGVHVLCDRYVFSSLAYQSSSLPMKNIIDANAFALKLLPDLTVFINAAPETCIKRINENREETELFESIEQARLIRDNYFTSFGMFSGKANVAVIDGNGAADKVFALVMENVKPLFLDLICDE